MHYKPGQSAYKELLSGVFMKVLTVGDQSMLCKFELKQGAVIPAHQHPQEQCGYMVSGKMRFFGDEGEAIIEPGCSWNFKGGVVHGVVVLEDSVVVEVFSPVRQDYLAVFSPQK